jgi:hypothetical protein
MLGAHALIPVRSDGVTQSETSTTKPEPVGASAGLPIDWAACLDCHTLADAGLPALSMFRPTAFAVPPASCEACHEPLDLAGPRTDWTHPVRSIAAHLGCTDCHVAVPHGVPPPAHGDLKGKAASPVTAIASAALSAQWSHGADPRVRCRDCHPAHQPMRAAQPLPLLPAHLRDEWRGLGDWYQGNAACLDCHAPAGLIFPLDRGFVTLNTANYHQLHLDNARLFCIECHDPHGSRRRGMVRDSLLDGRLLHFNELIDGGSCTVTCHGVDHQDWRYINRVF